VDPLNVVELTRGLVDIDSTTGREPEVAGWLTAFLEGRGYAVERQPVSGDRVNLFADAGGGRDVVLSTHLDCVPPFFPSRIEGGLLYGRGACDAKGILAAQVAAAERIRAAGEPPVALLFVVGEERGSEGARAANARPRGSRFLVNGEPTDNQLAAGTRGVWRIRLHARGRAAHSSLPELGESAIEKLLAALQALADIPLPADALFGRTFYTIGTIQGGVAPNVIPPSAQAEVLFRTVGPAAAVSDAVEPIRSLVTIEEVLEVPPARFDRLPGFDPVVFPFTTDVPLLAAWGRPVLVGPGSVAVAHTDHEHVAIAELERAVDVYVSVVRSLRGEAASAAGAHH
jgi:acetylornithine deacetylase